jgi:hypothetical protein
LRDLAIDVGIARDALRRRGHERVPAAVGEGAEDARERARRAVQRLVHVARASTIDLRGRRGVDRIGSAAGREREQHGGQERRKRKPQHRAPG